MTAARDLLTRHRREREDAARDDITLEDERDEPQSFWDRLRRRPHGQLSVEEVADAELHERLVGAEADQDLEYVGTGNSPSRALRRHTERELKRLTRAPVACTSATHPILGTRTPRGAALLRRRRARNAVAKRSRKVNR